VPKVSVTVRIWVLMSLLWASELALARISSDRQMVADIVLSALMFIGFGAVLTGLAHAPLAEKWRKGGAALVSGVPVGLLVLGITGFQLGIGVVGVGVAGVVGTLVAAGGAWQLDDDGILPAPIGVLMVAVASAMAWGIEAVPAPSIWGSAAVMWLFLAASSLRPITVVIPVAVTLAISLVPVRAPSATWTATGDVPDGPDIILLVVDTLRADQGMKMATYRRLAAEGAAFPDAQAAAPFTLPSMASLHTGLAISDHGAGTRVDGKKAPMRSDVATLAERLAAHGYDTTAVIGRNPYVGARFGFDRGFALFDHPDDLSNWALPRGPGLGSSARPIVTRLMMAAGIGERRLVRDADEVVDRAAKVMAQRRDRPVFMWMHFLDCHLPYRHAMASSLPFGARLDLDGGNWNWPRIRALDKEPYWPTPEGTTVFKQGYQHEIDLIDTAMMDFLDAIGPPLERGRVVVLVSDHGEEFFEHGIQGHGLDLYQEVVSVPLVVTGLGKVPAPNGPVHHIDVAPTLLSAAGLSVDGLPGTSLSAARPARVTITENLLFKELQGRYSIRDGRWKAVVFPDHDELYDLTADPDEKNDISGSHPDRIAEMKRAAPTPATLTTEAVEEDATLKSMLEDLGYVDE